MGEYQDWAAKHGSARKAASALNIPRSTFLDRLKRESGKTHAIREKITVSNPGFTKVCYFTDSHNQPGLIQDRFLWLATLINKQKPDIVIDGGDGDDFHSLCSHERNETFKGKLKPSLARDLECAAQARKLMKDNITHECRKIITLGNHEHRLWTFEDNNPEMYGIPSKMYLDILAATGWEHVRFGESVNVGGVAFTHVPIDQSGKPVAGEGCVKKVAEKSTCDTIFGHVHYETIVRAHKFGESKSVMAMSASCFMPEGYVPSYVKNTRKQFSHGAYIFMIRNGRVESIKSYSMAELEDGYNGSEA